MAVAGVATAQTANSTWLFNSTLNPTTNVNGQAKAAVLQGGSATYGSDNVLNFGAGKSYLNVTSSELLQAASGLTTNGGGNGSWVNIFTFIEAVKTTAAGGFGLYDSNDGSSGNGPEAWVDKTGHLNTGWDGKANTTTGHIYTSTATIDPTQWHWYAVTVNCSTGHQATNVYVDGNLMVTGVTDVADGKEPLYLPPNPTDFFNYNNVADATRAGVEVAALYTYGQELTQSQIQQAVPEPISMTLLGLGALTLIRRRK
jgi:hypothetical protein